MPSADAFEPQFDFDPPEGDDAWADNTNNNTDNNNTPPPQAQPPVLSTKSKKKKKKPQKLARAVDDGDESSSYPKSVTPSPPVHHGVKLQVDSPVQGAAEGATNMLPLVDLDEDEEPTLFEQDVEQDADPPPFKPVAVAAVKPSPPHSSSQPTPPAVKSPRPAAARPLPPSSPPSRPLSMYPTRERQNSFSTHRAPSQPSRRESFANHASPRSRFVDPPPPHMPQPHFFHIPDFGLGFNQKQEKGSPAGSEGYCCRLDTLADAGDAASAKKARDALLVGCEGGLEVFRVLGNKLEVIGRLEGLGGAVIGAKILPHTERLDPLQELRPLVAVVVHGPMPDHRGEKRVDDDNETPSHFQTTVDVYSLRAQRYVATLYQSVPIAVEQPVVGQISSLPEPVGDLHLDAAGRFITVSSGKSGEVLVFTSVPNCGLEEAHYRCVGKFWTSLQTTMPTPAAQSASGSAEAAATEGETKEQPRIPVCSLSQRWLAILPPSSSSNISIQGIPIISDINPTPPGISTHAAPPQPVVTCEVVGTDPEGAWSRLGRQAAQGLVKYSQKGIEIGLQGWKELTHPSPPNGRQPQDRASSKEDMFPPTKAFLDDPGRMAKEPALVSLIDLESLLLWEEHKPKYMPPFMATFALVEGCNFLSLSSTGTRLLTASRKGEVSTVWDLRQVAHGVPRCGTIHEDDISTSPCIKQLQRIARNTPSTILECAWSRDDDAIALLTAHGTIHLHEVTLKPVPRKRKRASTGTTLVPPAPDKADATVSLSTGLSPPSSNQGFLGSFLGSSWTALGSQVNGTLRNIPGPAIAMPTTFAGFRDATAAAGNAGSRAVARGISQGYTAAKGGAMDYWTADDNKIRYAKAVQTPGCASSLVWIQRRGGMVIAFAGGGNVHLNSVQRVQRRKGREVVGGFRAERYSGKTFPLANIQTRAEMGGLQSLRGGGDGCWGMGVHGFWSLRGGYGGDGVEEREREMGDVETNPPYCPFHVDSRVNVYGFEEDVAWESRGHGGEEKQWTFGDELPVRTKINEKRSEFDDFSGTEEEEGGVGSQMESRLTVQGVGGKGQGEEIRIHTRRKKGRGGGVEMEEFGEDGDGM